MIYPDIINDSVIYMIYPKDRNYCAESLFFGLNFHQDPSFGCTILRVPIWQMILIMMIIIIKIITWRLPADSPWFLPFLVSPVLKSRPLGRKVSYTTWSYTMLQLRNKAICYLVYNSLYFQTISVSVIHCWNIKPGGGLLHSGQTGV